MYRKLMIMGLCTWFAGTAHAMEIDVEITNLTHGIYFTPLLISAHGESAALFTPGMAASTELQAMAEGGDLTGLVAMMESAGAVNVVNPAGGLLAPATTATATGIDTGELDRLSIVAMILPTNDGFVALEGWTIPVGIGSYTLWLNAYDAGTEANDEQVTGGGAPGAPGIPANPGGNGGTGGSGVTTSETNQTVHIHRGNVGDTDAAGGVSDVDSRIHRWLNPVAKVVVTVH